MTLLWICLGSITGTLIRYGSSLLLNIIYPPLPIGTLLVNLVGAFLIGIVMGLAHCHYIIPEPIKLGITIGFLGSLTTFSSFSAEVVSLLMTHEYIRGCLLALLHVGGSLTLTYCGMRMVLMLARS